MERKGLAVKLGFIGLMVCLIVSLLAFGCEQPTTPTTNQPHLQRQGLKPAVFSRLGILRMPRTSAIHLSGDSS